jgi:hypothetical protein
VGDVAQVVEVLPSKHKVLSSNTSTAKTKPKQNNKEIIEFCHDYGNIIRSDICVCFINANYMFYVHVNGTSHSFVPTCSSGLF